MPQLSPHNLLLFVFFLLCFICFTFVLSKKTSMISNSRQAFLVNKKLIYS